MTGLIYCAECGQKMYNHRGGTKKKNGLFSTDGYNCSTYMHSHIRETATCVNHWITTGALRSLILQTIRTVGKYAIENEVEFEEKVREASALRQANAAKDLKVKIKKAGKRITELVMLIKKLYELYAAEKISEKHFNSLLEDYEKEQAELQAILSTDEANL